VHVEADLLDDVGDVKVGEYQVLEGTSEAPELSRINNRRLRLDRDFDMRVHGCQNWLAVCQASALKDVKSILAM
jgi:hypothetical protein